MYGPFRQCEAVFEFVHLPTCHAVPGEMLLPACDRFSHFFPDSPCFSFVQSKGPDVAQDTGPCGRAACQSAGTGPIA